MNDHRQNNEAPRPVLTVRKNLLRRETGVGLRFVAKVHVPAEQALYVFVHNKATKSIKLMADIIRLADRM